jgi:sigma-E factor negative regulatory protein RseA
MKNAHPSPSDQTEPICSSALSALVDGEVLPHELERVLNALTETDPDADLSRWHSYQVIGDVLRQTAPASATRSPQDFLAGVRAELQKPVAAIDAPLRPAGPEAIAQSVLDKAPIRVPISAANDAVFRWKLVARFASLAAVMAVSWTQLQTTVENPGGKGAVLAQREAPFELASVAAVQPDAPVRAQGLVPAQAAPGTVAVQTPQGWVMRDPQLEALMDQHRQHGGMTALQMPTVFLRNATYDAPVR